MRAHAPVRSSLLAPRARPCSFVNSIPIVGTFLTGILPSLALTLFLLFLPAIIRWVIRVAGRPLSFLVAGGSMGASVGEARLLRSALPWHPPAPRGRPAGPEPSQKARREIRVSPLTPSPPPLPAPLLSRHPSCPAGR